MRVWRCLCQSLVRCTNNRKPTVIGDGTSANTQPSCLQRQLIKFLYVSVFNSDNLLEFASPLLPRRRRPPTFCHSHPTNPVYCSDMPSLTVKAVVGRMPICGWPTDVLSIQHEVTMPIHTVILFVPGNPGVIHWYTNCLTQIVQRLGVGYSVRGVSYAGHGVGDDVVGSDDQSRDTSVAWTMDGQIKHKLEWIDGVLADWRKQHSSTNEAPTTTPASSPRIIFISHSIGAHFVQSVLLRRPDILSYTHQVIHLMPFFRFDPPTLKKALLSRLANHHEYTIPAMKKFVKGVSRTVPKKIIDVCMHRIAGVECDYGRSIAMDIFVEPNMMRNHLVLGAEEIRGEMKRI